MSKTITLTKAADGFIKELEALSKKPSTIGTSRRSLDLFIAHQGEDKIVSKILPVHVGAFFKSDAATMQPGKDGSRPRAEASVKQIRRIVRQFLIWCTEKKYIDKNPIPKAEAERGGGVRRPSDNEQTEDTGSGETEQAEQEAE